MKIDLEQIKKRLRSRIKFSNVCFGMAAGFNVVFIFKQFNSYYVITALMIIAGSYVWNKKLTKSYNQLVGD